MNEFWIVIGLLLLPSILALLMRVGIMRKLNRVLHETLEIKKEVRNLKKKEPIKERSAEKAKSTMFSDKGYSSEKMNRPEEKKQGEKREEERPKEQKPVPQTRPVAPKPLSAEVPKASKPITVKEIAAHRIEQIRKEKKENAVKEEVKENTNRPPKGISMDSKKNKEGGKPQGKRDFEKFIGENLMNKIGIGILVIGIALFVKYAIDIGWINEVGRTIVGFLSGALLIGVAHQLKDNYKAFSSVLTGGGLGVLYLTVGIAFREYQLFSQVPAFIVMVVITGFSILLSILYDKKELAILAILGGFATPLIASTGEGNYIILFSYLIILNVGMLVLAYFKKWNSVNVISYICTYLMFGAWFFKDVYQVENAPYKAAVLFGAVFYVLFFMANIINNLKKKVQFNGLELSLILSNTFIYFSIGILSLGEIFNGELRGVFTILFSAFNFVFAFLFYKRKSVDINLVYLLIGLVLTFLSLAAPIQLEGNHITLFWAAEAVLLLWLAQKSKIDILKIGSVVVNGLVLVSLYMDWEALYHSTANSIHLTAILNKGFITTLVTGASFALSQVLMRKDSVPYKNDWWKSYDIFLRWASLSVLFLGGLLELNYQLAFYCDLLSIRITVIFSYCLAVLLALVAFERHWNNQSVKEVLYWVSMGGVSIYALFMNNQVIKIRNAYLDGITGIGGFLYHYLIVGIVIGLLWSTYQVAKKIKMQEFSASSLCLWLIGIITIIITSAELDHVVVLMNYEPGLSMSHIVSQNQKIGYPIIWGLSSFVFMFTGMKRKNRELRIMSLSLFSLILLKLFLFDIWEVSQIGKVLAFVSLGIILLIVSFMYQRLKKLVLDENQEKK